MLESFKAVAVGFEIALLVAGLAVLWRIAIGPAARTRRAAPRLPRWEVPFSEFLLFCVFVVCGMQAIGIAGALVAEKLGLTGELRTIAYGASAQFGMLLGVGFFFARTPRQPSPPREHNVLLSGFVTFLISLPVLTATGAAWQFALKVFGLPAARQDLVGLFEKADSPTVLAAMTLLAVVVAPVVEELVFRAGLFRYLRSRVPRAVAVLAPAVFFAALHVSWSTLEGFASFGPLIVLAAIFSLAYERTGRIGTPIVAHALFNLNTVMLIFSGVTELT